MIYTSVTTGKPKGALRRGTAGGEQAAALIALVGYTPDRFIVRNSWGPDWGDKGFVYASLAYAKAAFTESYGVVLNK